MRAGILRHRVDIQNLQVMQDAETGETMRTWKTVWPAVPASVEPLSAREFIAAQATQSQIVARVVIRWRDGLDASMRILHGEKIYNPAGFLADKNSGRDYLTIPCTEGTNDG